MAGTPITFTVNIRCLLKRICLIFLIFRPRRKRYRSVRASFRQVVRALVVAGLTRGSLGVIIRVSRWLLCPLPSWLPSSVRKLVR
jgi:hypothetical protein